MAERRARRIDVALVGRERPGDENLALRYLAAALEGAGHHAELVPLCGPDELDGAAAAVLARGAPLVGLSIPDADVAVDALALVRLLRRRGYAGHVTCGGALATLVRGEILGKHAGFDSVVRHDGELPIVAIADAVAAGRSVEGVAGVTTRAGDGPPAPVLDPTPLALRPRRPKRLPRILGVPVARMLASRGCPGRCPYCGPAALQREAVREGLRGGADRRTLAERGVGGVRRRSAADVANEAAELHRRRGARFFHLLDDNLLAGEPAVAAAWLRELAAGLAARGVGATAWSLQMDPAALDDDVAAALAELGVVRVLLGVEALTREGLRSLGRPGDPAANRAAIERLRGRGIVTLFNSLLVHPSATPAGIAAELEALGELEGVHFDALALAVYPGTEAWRRLCEAGEATGGMLGWRFEPRDPVVARFRAALVRLRLQGAGRYGASVFAHDVAVNLAMARRLGLPAYDAGLEGELAGALAELNETRVAAWRGALALAAAELASAERVAAVAALVGRLGRDLARVEARVGAVEARLERAARVRPGAGNLLVRSALAAGFTLFLAPQPGCDSADDDGPPAVDASAPDAALPDALVPDAATGCSTEEALAIVAAAGCPPCEGQIASYGIAIDAEGHLVDVLRSDGTPVPPEIRDCYRDALAGETFPCLAGEEIWQECVICLF